MRARSSSDHISEPSTATRSFSEPRSKPVVARDLDEPQRVGRDGGEHGDAKVAHERELQQRAAGADGHDHRAQPLGPVVEAEAAGEQPERRRDLHDVRARDPGRGQAARHHLAPLDDVGGGVRVQDRVAGGPARHVHAGVAGGVAAGQLVGIGVAQLRLGQEGQPAPVLDRLDVAGPDVAQPACPRGIGEHARQRGPHALDLQPRQRLAVERFQVGLEHGEKYTRPAPVGPPVSARSYRNRVGSPGRRGCSNGRRG